MKNLLDIFKDKNISLQTKLDITYLVHEGSYNMEEILKHLKNNVEESKLRYHKSVETLGYFGNVWIRLQRYNKADVYTKGHKHHHDHISLLVKGGLKVYVEGQEPFEVWASTDPTKPTFFEVPAEHIHNLVPLEDDTIAYCVFALKDSEGEYTNNPEESDWLQYGASDVP